MKHWIDSWVKDIEHEYQFIHSFKELEKYAKKEKKTIGIQTYKCVMTILERMDCCTSKWARCYKKNLLDLEQSTSSIGESSNSSLKGSVKKGSMAAMKLSKSADATVKNSKSLEVSKIYVINWHIMVYKLYHITH